MKVVDAAFSYIVTADFWEGLATFDDGETHNFTVRRDGAVRMQTHFRRSHIQEYGVRIWRSSQRETAIRKFFSIAEPNEDK